MRPALALAALSLLTATGCAGDAGPAERAACQRRIVEAASPGGPAGGDGAAAAFAGARQRLEGLQKEGCSEDQTARADSMAQAAGRVAAAAGRVGDLRQAAEQGRTPGSDRAILEFTHELEQYEHRRAALQVELERLTKEAGGP